jgi:predicted TIM-barrel fold metal-dependent hydrolase
LTCGALRGADGAGCRALSEAPYALENRLLFTEIYRFCPELQDRFLPFVTVDPVRKIKEQLEALESLAGEHPVYGVKVAPVACQSKVTGLLGEGEALLEFAKRRDLPVLLHVTVDPKEEFSQATDTFHVVERHPELRFCLAHCIGFNREFLEKADGLPNVWVDTSALKIQVQAAYEGQTFMAKPEERFDWDYAPRVDHGAGRAVPDTILWGSDPPTTPSWSAATRLWHLPGVHLKGTYEQERPGALTEQAEGRLLNTAASCSEEVDHERATTC